MKLFGDDFLVAVVFKLLFLSLNCPELFYSMCIGAIISKFALSFLIELAKYGFMVGKGLCFVHFLFHFDLCGFWYWLFNLHHLFYEVLFPRGRNDNLLLTDRVNLFKLLSWKYLHIKVLYFLFIYKLLHKLEI